MEGISGSTPAPQDPMLFKAPPTEGKQEREKTAHRHEHAGSGQVDQSQQDNSVMEQHETEHSHEDQEGGSSGGGGGGGGDADSDSGGGGFSGGGGQSFSDDGGITTLEDFIELGGPVTSSTSVTSIMHVYNTDKIEVSEVSTSRLSIDPNIKWNSDMPQLFRARNVDLNAVKEDMKGNLWLSSFFLTDLTQNLFEIVKAQKQIHSAEGKNLVKAMLKALALAEQIGDAIMAKAQKEANMYMMLSIFAAVSLAISLIGFGLSMKGLATKAKASNLKSAKADAPDTTTAGGTPSNSAGAQATKINNKNAAKAKTEAKANDLNGQPETKTTSDATIKSLKNKAAKLDKVGTLLSTAAPIIEKIAENAYRAATVEDIAKSERDRTLFESYKQAMQQAYDNASKSMSEAGQAIDAALQMLQKIQDETSRAHSLRGG